MGYTTYFKGQFHLDKVLRPEHKAYLQRFSEIKHEALNEMQLLSLPDPLRTAVGLPLGKNGMYFVGMMEKDSEYPSALNTEAEYTNVFPSQACQWAPTETGTGIRDVGEKFYGYTDWQRFLLKHFLIPWGYHLTGTIEYQGEQGEHGRIVIENHQVTKIVDSDSLLPRQSSVHVDEEIHIYWLTVGGISDAAHKALLAADCPVLTLHQEPPVVLVGLPYDINYCKRHGHDDLMIWTSEGIILHSKGLRLWQDELWEQDYERVLDKPWQGFVRMTLQLSGENIPEEDGHSY